MTDAYDPDEKIGLDMEPEEALRRLLGAGEGSEDEVEPVGEDEGSEEG